MNSENSIKWKIPIFFSDIRTNFDFYYILEVHIIISIYNILASVNEWKVGGTVLGIINDKSRPQLIEKTNWIFS